MRVRGALDELCQSTHGNSHNKVENKVSDSSVCTDLSYHLFFCRQHSLVQKRGTHIVGDLHALVRQLQVKQWVHMQHLCLHTDDAAPDIQLETPLLELFQLTVVVKDALNSTTTYGPHCWTKVAYVIASSRLLFFCWIVYIDLVECSVLFQ